jgi:hypothetical protein
MFTALCEMFLKIKIQNIKIGTCCMRATKALHYMPVLHPETETDFLLCHSTFAAET